MPLLGICLKEMKSAYKRDNCKPVSQDMESAWVEAKSPSLCTSNILLASLTSISSIPFKTLSTVVQKSHDSPICLTPLRGASSLIHLQALPTFFPVSKWTALLVNILHPDLCLQHLPPVPTSHSPPLHTSFHEVLFLVTGGKKWSAIYLVPSMGCPHPCWHLWLYIPHLLTAGMITIGYICQLVWDPWGTNPPYSPTAQCVRGIHCTPIHSLCNILNSSCLQGVNISFPCKRQHPLHYLWGQQRKKGTAKNYLKYCWVRLQQLHMNVGRLWLEREEERHVGLAGRVKVLFPHLDDRCKGISYRFIKP